VVGVGGEGAVAEAVAGGVGAEDEEEGFKILSRTDRKTYCQSHYRKEALQFSKKSRTWY